MTDRAIVRTLRLAAAVGALMTVAAIAIMLFTGRVEYWFKSHTVVSCIYTIGFAAVVWLAIPNEPRNRTLWAMAIAMAAAPGNLVYAVTPSLVDGPADTVRYPYYVPADNPTSVAYLYMVTEPLSQIAVFAALALCFLLFPNGNLRSRRWRRVAWIAVASSGGAAATYVVAYRPGFTTSPEHHAVLGVLQLLAMASVLASVVSLVLRFRSSGGRERHQIRWVLWGAAVMALLFSFAIVILGDDDAAWPPATIAVGFAALIASFGVAVGRHHLYDVRVVVSRAIVYGSLGVVITAAYVAVVVGLGELLGGADRPNTLLAITATTIVAVTFQPLRIRLQRWADRLVYGRRTSPHAMLSEFTRRLRANDDGLLDQVPRSIVEGTSAHHAQVRVGIDGVILRTAEWATGPRASTDEVTTFAIRYEGVVYGDLDLAVRAGQRLSEQDRRLAEETASGMGLAMRNRALTEALALRVAELRRSRRRLVAVQDETRRRLERDLHDGAQQQLVAIRVKLGLARTIAVKDDATATVDELDRLAAATDVVIDAVRDFARGVYPALLEAEGLSASVRASAVRAEVPVTVSADGLGRYDRTVESTVNLCVGEALRNAVVHADASRVVVSITECDGRLDFAVSDDGSGCVVDDPATAGGGLGKLFERIDALGGSLRVSSTAGSGTVVHGSLPLAADGMVADRAMGASA